jgi:biofilm protein TabA
MIVTDLAHIDRQIINTQDFKKAIAFLRRPDLHKLPDGKVEIDGDRVFAVVQRYSTVKSDTPKFEYHRTYIDIQFIVSGREIIGWAPAESMTITDPYDEGKDVCFGSIAKNKWTPVLLQEGQFAILWPEDEHAPKLPAGEPSAVVKIIVKVKVSNL